MEDIMKEFHSDYADVVYRKEENAVLVTWKKRAILDDYREPTGFALELLQEFANSNLVVDARNGFEDDKRDAEWAISYLLPEMAKTGCRFVSFIMNEENLIEDEMDMWTVEFQKYFIVNKAADYAGAVAAMNQ